LRAGERGQARGLGIPLVPANQRRDTGVAGIERAEAQVPRREVIFFEIQWIVGDVHLAIQAQQTAIGIDHRRGVVIHARGSALEHRPHDDNGQLGREAREAFGGGAWDGFGEIEQFGFFFAAEILRAEKFLHANDLRALSRSLANAPFRLGEILGRIGRAGHLHEPDAKFVLMHKPIVPAYDFL